MSNVRSIDGPCLRAWLHVHISVTMEQANVTRTPRFYCFSASSTEKLRTGLGTRLGMSRHISSAQLRINSLNHCASRCVYVHWQDAGVRPGQGTNKKPFVMARTHQRVVERQQSKD